MKIESKYVLDDVGKKEWRETKRKMLRQVSTNFLNVGETKMVSRRILKCLNRFCEVMLSGWVILRSGESELKCISRIYYLQGRRTLRKKIRSEAWGLAASLHVSSHAKTMGTL